VDEHDELDEEKKPTKRVSTGSATGLTSRSSSLHTRSIEADVRL